MFIFIEKPFCCFWLIRIFFCAQENDLAMTFSALLLVFVVLFCFQERLVTILAELLTATVNSCFKKNMLTDEHAVSFWREPTEGSLLLRLGFSIFYTKPKCVYK